MIPQYISHGQKKKSRIRRKYMNFKGRIFILCGFSKKKTMTWITCINEQMD